MRYVLTLFSNISGFPAAVKTPRIGQPIGKHLSEKGESTAEELAARNTSQKIKTNHNIGISKKYVNNRVQNISLTGTSSRKSDRNRDSSRILHCNVANSDILSDYMISNKRNIPNTEGNIVDTARSSVRSKPIFRFERSKSLTNAMSNKLEHGQTRHKPLHVVARRASDIHKNNPLRNSTLKKFPIASSINRFKAKIKSPVTEEVQKEKHGGYSGANNTNIRTRYSHFSELQKKFKSYCSPSERKTCYG